MERIVHRQVARHLVSNYLLSDFRLHTEVVDRQRLHSSVFSDLVAALYMIYWQHLTLATVTSYCADYLYHSDSRTPC